MRGRQHVLLIGIDAYDGGGMLTGCVNDIDAIQRLLVDHVGVPRIQIRRLAAPRTGDAHETDVPEELPLLDTIRAALERLGSDEVEPGDRVFIYYSGHGTQCIVPGRDGRRVAREALLPKDKKRGTENRLLFDWELNTLIARIAARTPAVTVILDCCNSAGATRGLDPAEAAGLDRFWPTPELVLPPGGLPAAGSVRGVASGLGSIQRCQVVAACRDDQRARESGGTTGLSNGELTRALITQLSQVDPAEFQNLRWGQIWRDVEAAVHAANPRQSPWLSGPFGRRVFGFGLDDDMDPGYALVRINDRYGIDVGTLGGVTVDAEIGVYGADPPSFPPLDSNEDLAARQGILRVVRARPGSSEAVATTPFTWPEPPRGRLVRSGRKAALRVSLVPHDAELGAALEASPLIELAGPGPTELTLARRADQGWALVDDVHGTGQSPDEPVLAVIPANRLDLARAAVEHYHGYSAPLRQARACRDLPSLLRMWLLDCGDAALTAKQAQDPDLPQVQPGEHSPYEIGTGDRVCFVVENLSEVALTVTLLDCAASGRVLLLGEKRMPRLARHVFWFDDTLGVPFVAALPDDRAVGVDRIATIGTTRPYVSLRYLERRQSFEEILAPSPSTRGALRDLGGTPAPPAESWTSALTAVRVVRRR